ncbi:TetR family transcriptional regulator [Streptomyces sp. SID5914]|nr:TetR/AcrR family transcriptional regulator [Streptomyces sp. SID5914]MZG15073.1 TetR family transcriptional regulator [Streptomyces sp. SID5914]
MSSALGGLTPSESSPLRLAVGSAAPGAEKVLAAALDLFHAKGYGGTTVREIASVAGVTVAAVYYHFDSKQTILATLMTRAMHRALAQVSSAHAIADQNDPLARLRAIVDAHVRFNCTHQVEAFVGNSELRSLEGENRSQVVALRDAHEAMFRSVVCDGLAAGVFKTQHPEESVRAILAMSTAVAGWFKQTGSLTIDRVAREYVYISLMVLGCPDAEN